MPTSPDSSPPREESLFEPSSPTSPPPTAGFSFAPSSPSSPPPIEVGMDDLDEDTKRILKIRALAVKLAGGADIWDNLSEDLTDKYMEKATEEVENGNI